jgi:hypothetical protein
MATRRHPNSGLTRNNWNNRLRKTRRRRKCKSRSAAKLRFTKSTADIYSSNKLQTKGWVSIHDGYIYIARDKGRSYWRLYNIPLNKRPIISFTDSTKTIRIGANKIIIKSLAKYNKAKQYLKPYSKKSRRTKT